MSFGLEISRESLDRIKEKRFGLFVSVFFGRMRKLEKAIVRTVLRQTQILGAERIVVVKRFGVRRGYLDEVQENRSRNLVVEKMFFQNRGIASRFHLGELRLNRIVIDLRIDVLVLIVIGVQCLKNRLPIPRIFGSGDQTRPVALANFDLFAIMQM